MFSVRWLRTQPAVRRSGGLVSQERVALHHATLDALAIGRAIGSCFADDAVPLAADPCPLLCRQCCDLAHDNTVQRTPMTPAPSPPKARMAPRDRSRSRPATNGPRSFTRTSTHARTPDDRQTRNRVPNRSVR